MNKKDQYLDILKALSKKENKLLLEDGLRSKLFRRKLIFQNLLRNKITLTQAFQAILPESFRFKRNNTVNYYGYDQIILNQFFGNYPYEPVNLLDYQTYYFLQRKITRKERYLFFFSLVELIKEIIITDQYCAKEFIKNDSVVIDAGANIGIFSLFASHLTPKGKIYSFEPTKSTFEILNKNIINNNLQNSIFVYNLALGDKKEKTEIMIQDNNLGGENIILGSDFFKNREIEFNRKESVEMITIDNFIKENNIKKVDFIKIDTEGYEKQIIQGARNTIKEFSPVISCSAYHLKDDKIKIPELVKSISPNYKYKVEKKAEEDLIFWIINSLRKQ